MRTDAIPLEEMRLSDVQKLDDYTAFHERHRVFPAVFEDRDHKRILDVAAGVGAAAKRIADHYPAEITCNDISPKALTVLNKLGLPTVSFDIDNNEEPFPFPDGHFDAVVSLATLEHVIHLDHHLQEIHRILSPGGYFYISSPNYAALVHTPTYMLQGRSFHNPLREGDRYEFYAHVRYFTYRTLLEFVQSFGFEPDTVYLALPAGSTHYQAQLKKSPLKAWAFRYGMWFMYTFGSPRWASEPVLCFRKSDSNGHRHRPRKVVL
jgi:SAM-dependent methyltransferase